MRTGAKGAFVLVWLLMSAGAIAGDQDNRFEIVITRELMLSFLKTIPENYIVEREGKPLVTIPVRAQLGLPSASDEVPAAFLVGLPAKIHKTETALNAVSKVTQEWTGTAYCVRINGPFKGAPSAIEELKQEKTALAVFPAAQWDALTRTVDEKGKPVSPKINTQALGSRKISLSLPERAMWGVKFPPVDLGEVVVAWNQVGLRKELLASRNAAVSKLAALLTNPGGPKNQDQVEVIARATGFDRALGDPLTQMAILQATKLGLNTVNRALLKKVFCSDPPKDSAEELVRHKSRQESDVAQREEQAGEKSIERKPSESASHQSQD